MPSGLRQIVDQLTYAICKDQGLQKIIRTASGDKTYILPSRPTIGERIDNLFIIKQEAVKGMLHEAKYVGINVDYWSSISNEYLLGATAHFIDDNWILQMCTLGVYAMDERHFAEAVAEHITSAIQTWGIGEKVSTIGSDNARNMTAAIRKMAYELMPCGAHTLQLSLKKALDEAAVSPLLAKCRKIVGHFKHSPNNYKELKVQQVALGLPEEPLLQDVVTRWNSTLFMLQRLVKHKDAIIATLNQQQHRLAKITDAEWEKLRQLIVILQPCQKATELLGGECYVSCSVLLPLLAHLHKVMKVSDDDPAYIVRFKTAFDEDFTKRCKEDSNIEWLKLATALDPRFKTLSCLPKDERSQVWEVLEEKVNGITLTVGNAQEQDPVTDPASKRRKVFLFDYDAESDSGEDQEMPVCAKSDIKRYRSEPAINQEECPLKWWKDHESSYRNLAQVAIKYLGTTATTVPCERLFSKTGYIMDKKRSSLSGHSLNKLLCLSSWKATVKE